MTAETRTFAAEARELLQLVVHSLYQRKEVFLRELVSNASDALDKLRLEGLTRPELALGASEPPIRIELDRAGRTLTVADRGIGMSREELIENLGTIARSGTRAFLERLRGEGELEAGALSGLIGRFGVGFYSSFLVAEEVEVETLRAGTAQAWRWRSRGEGEYTLEEGTRAEHGTRVTLHVRERAPQAPGDEEEREPDWLDPALVRELVRRHSDFVEHEIVLVVDGGEPERVNTMRPIWARPREEVTPEQHRDFYRHLTHAFDEPLETVHFRAEGTLEYTALLYVPSERPFDLFEERRPRSRVALHVKRVLVDPECEQLLPAWLRFVRGVVDAQDLPLNVSRDVLQESAKLVAIRKRLVRKLVHALGELLASDRARYERFWEAFGAILKEGLWAGGEETDKLPALCLFRHTGGEGWTTLAEHVARLPRERTTIAYATGTELERLRAAPVLERHRARGIEVLLLTDPVDEWVVQRLDQFEGKRLVPVDRGEQEDLPAAEREALEQSEREHRGLLEAVESVLGARVGGVRLSARLEQSPAALVGEPGAPSPQLAELMRRAGQDVPEPKRTLELNPEHPLFARLSELAGKPAERERLERLIELVHGQALLAEGSPLADPARFSKLLTELLLAGAR